ncbi:MAG TPA: radical SAM protein [bacterium]|nr:radical SAM protein [bacterium]
MGSFGYFQITRRCDQHCLICSNPENDNSISLEHGIAYLDSLISDGGYEGVIITGGEPTLSEYLPEYLMHCADKGFSSVLITNGQNLASAAFAKKLKAAGLEKVVLSLYSCDPIIQGRLTGNPDSLSNVNKAAANLEKLSGITLSVTITMNKLNADHLSRNVEHIVKRMPSVNHVVFNNLDPLMNRAAQHPETLHRLNDIDIELTRAVDMLRSNKMTYRIERVPLCYMGGYEHNSTETRRIVKNEKVRILFLDEKGEVDQAQGDFLYGKAECCKVCYLNDICMGLYSMNDCYMSEELFPVFHTTKEEVAEKVVSNAP